MKRSQAAMEFLMTYGWALLVVVIAIAALTFFGILNPDRFLPEKTELKPGLSVKGATMDTVEITLIIENSLGATIRDLQINVSECTNANKISTPVTIREGNTRIITILCGGTTAESKFNSDLIINYSTRTLGSTLTHTDRGWLSLNVGKAADGVGDSCLSSTDCASTYCETLSYTCTNGIEGDICAVDDECAVAYCQTLSYTCTDGSVDDPCGDASECAVDYCQTYTDKCSEGNEGDPCVLGTECESGLCGANACGPPGA